MGEAALKLESRIDKSVAVSCPTNIEAEREKELFFVTTALETKAALIAIDDDENYEKAAKFCRSIKQTSAKVMAFFKPMKKAANKAHREICGREKAILQPLVNAESALKHMMSEYILENEREQRMLEEVSQKTTHDAMEPPSADLMSRSITISPTIPKVQGISQTKDWEITSIDFTKVSLSISGVKFQTPQTKGFCDMIHLVVLQHIRTAKGAVQIPGIVFREIYKTSIRK
jgi:hypothetical protein